MPKVTREKAEEIWEEQDKYYSFRNRTLMHYSVRIRENGTEEEKLNRQKRVNEAADELGNLLLEEQNIPSNCPSCGSEKLEVFPFPVFMVTSLSQVGQKYPNSGIGGLLFGTLLGSSCNNERAHGVPLLSRICHLCGGVQFLATSILPFHEKIEEVLETFRQDLMEMEREISIREIMKDGHY